MNATFVPSTVEVQRSYRCSFRVQFSTGASVPYTVAILHSYLVRLQQQLNTCACSTVALLNSHESRVYALYLEAPAYSCLPPEQCFMSRGPSHLHTDVSHGVSTQAFTSDTMYKEIKRVNSYCDGPRLCVYVFRLSLGNAT